MVYKYSADGTHKLHSLNYLRLTIMNKYPYVKLTMKNLTEIFTKYSGIKTLYYLSFGENYEFRTNRK